MGTSARRPLSLLYLCGGLLALAAASVLTVEKLQLMKDPAYTPSCSLNPILNCGSVMATAQAEAFGVPNPLLGLVGFSVVATTGAILLGGASLPRWLWLATQAGMTFAMAFVGWLMFQSIYRIEALCPYCMIVWSITIPLFLYTTLHTARSGVLGRSVASSRGILVASANHAMILTVTYLTVIALILERFWSYWTGLLT